MLRVQRDVREAHLHFGHDAPDSVREPSPEVVSLRMKLIREEMNELMGAMIEGDVPGVAQELVDLIYVAAGTAVAYGVDLEPVWDAVHAANMAKRPAPGGGKWIKPEGWRKPDVARILEEGP